MFVNRWFRALVRMVPAPATGERSDTRWGVAASLLLSLFVAARLGVAQPIEPATVPFPTLDQRLLARQSAEQRRLREVASRQPLPLEIRAVGELVRRVGFAEASGEAEQAAALHRRLEQQVARVLQSNETDAMLGLRAIQAYLFRERLLSWEGEEPQPRELMELGGTFPRQAARLFRRGAAPPAEELEAAFIVRWTKLTGLERNPNFAMTANELRLNARLRLRWADTLSAPERQSMQLHTIARLAELNPEYPAAFATGIARYLGGEYRAAFEQFSLHLRKNPDGPWTLRAQNHATAAAAQLVSGTAGSGQTW